LGLTAKRKARTRDRRPAPGAVGLAESIGRHTAGTDAGIRPGLAPAPVPRAGEIHRRPAPGLFRGRAPGPGASPGRSQPGRPLPPANAPLDRRAARPRPEPD